jgi:hypothetical protein
LLAHRDLDDALELTEMASEVLAEALTGKNGQHALTGLFRQSVFGRLAAEKKLSALQVDWIDCAQCYGMMLDGPRSRRRCAKVRSSGKTTLERGAVRHADYIIGLELVNS